MKRHGHGLEHRRLGKGQALRQAVHDTLRNHHVLRKSPGAAIISARNAKYPAVVAEVDFCAKAIVACAARNGGIESCPIAYRKVTASCTQGYCSSRRLMSHHNGWYAAAR